MFIVGEAVDEDSLDVHRRDRLASYKVPERFFFVNELPKTGLGKVIKQELVTLLPSR